jgi:hypothetical protein
VPNIRVKIIARGQSSYTWARQIPKESASWGKCEFIFNREAREYDWLVVIDDVSRAHRASAEVLACADPHTMLVTTEPPTITSYGRKFCRQFAHVLTSQPPQALPHPNRIYSQTGNLWFNGLSFDELLHPKLPEKTEIISTVCSTKQQKHTIHNARARFTEWLQERLPDLTRVGHGHRFVKEKHEVLVPYRFHLAIENYIGPHHWTEKLSDPFLSMSVPIYYGCPNIADYFPEDSYVAIDIKQPEAALERIRTILADPDAYAKRLEALREAKRRVMYEYNLIAMLSDFISKNFNPNMQASQRPLYGRKQMRFRHPRDLFDHINWSLCKTFS